MLKLKLPLALSLVTFLTCGCSQNPISPIEPKDEILANEIIGSSGGSVIGGQVELDIPAGVVSENTEFRIIKPGIEEIINQGDAVSLDYQHILESDADEFNEYITVRFSNSSDGSYIVRFDGESDKWVYSGTGENIRECLTKEFSLWDVVTGWLFDTAEEVICETELDSEYNDLNHFIIDSSQLNFCLWTGGARKWQEHFYPGSMAEQVIAATTGLTGGVINSLYDLENIGNKSNFLGSDILFDLYSSIQSIYDVVDEHLGPDVWEELTENMKKLGWEATPQGITGSELANSNGLIYQYLELELERKVYALAGNNEMVVEMSQQEIPILEKIIDVCNEMFDLPNYPGFSSPTQYEFDLAITTANLAAKSKQILEKEILLLDTGPGLEGKLIFSSAVSVGFYSDLHILEFGEDEPTNLSNTPNEGEADPVFSPDGSMIAYTLWKNGKSEVYVANADFSNKINLSDSPDSKDGSPSWSPDGSRIAFQSDRTGDFEIYTVLATGGLPINICNSPDSKDGSPSWSPDGSRIAFQSDRGGNWEVYDMDSIDGSDQTNLSNFPSADDYRPDYSPDGSMIAFVSDRDGNREIYVMYSNGSDQTNLSNFPGALDSYPCWSPDGSMIAFTSFRDVNLEIYVMNSDGGNQRRITNNEAIDQQADWCF